jgi:hypothetical protein
VPLFGLAVPFILGARGNVWAYRNGGHHDLQAFLKGQRRWALAVPFVYGGILALCAIGGFTATQALKQSEPFQLARSQVVSDPRVLERFGTPIETGMVGGSFETAGASTGHAAIDFAITGARASGRVYVKAAKELGRWSLQAVQVAVEGQQERLVIVPDGSASGAPAYGVQR